jgi:acetylornithine deacetylase
MTALLIDEELLGRLVAFDSTSRNSNLPIADFICDYLDGPSVRVERLPSADETKTNLCITFGPAADRTGADSTPGLVLSGHMDVVPADEEEWRSDPFSLGEEDGRLVGRGACDMKGFLAVAMNAARRLEGSLAHPLVLLLTYDEELGTLGARHLVEAWPRDWRLPTAAIIGEPTSLRVVRMHKGHMKLRLTLFGETAHSGYPHLGVNAIESAGRAITALTRLREGLEGERPDLGDYFPEVPFVAFNIATVDGGRAVNVVPDRCVIEIGYRVLPGMDGSVIAGRTRDVLAAALSADAYELDVLQESPPMRVPDDSNILDALREESGETDLHSVSFATDAGWLQSLGLECAIWGPGDIAVAHKPNEWVPIEELRRCAAVLDRVIARLCGDRGAGV